MDQVILSPVSYLHEGHLVLAEGLVEVTRGDVLHGGQEALDQVLDLPTLRPEAAVGHQLPGIGLVLKSGGGFGVGEGSFVDQGARTTGLGMVREELTLAIWWPSFLVMRVYESRRVAALPSCF